MLYLLGILLTLFFFGVGAYRRWRAGDELDAPYLTRLVWVSVGLGMGVGAILVPSMWVLVSYSIFGGSIENNLPPGANPGFLLSLLVIGSLMTLVYTFVGYRDHVFPYRIIESRLHNTNVGLDPAPLQRRPDDSPE